MISRTGKILKDKVNQNFKKGEMDLAIKTLLSGKTYFSSEIAEKLNLLDGFKE